MRGKQYKVPSWLRKYLGQEDILTIQCSNFLKANNLLFHHTFNEGKRTRTMQQKVLGFGVMTGIPDFLIFEPKGGFVGLAVELKVKYKNGGKNYLSPAQKTAQEELKKKRWKVVTVWTIDEFFKEIRAYFQ